jgi:hypothetical protein
MGNIAFPDFYSVYLVAIIPPNQKIALDSFDIKKKNFDFLTILFSITLYDCTGKIIVYYDEGIENLKCIYTTTTYSVAMIRIYCKDPANTLYKLVRDANINFDLVKQNTKTLVNLYKKVISFKKLIADNSIVGFRFSQQNTALYYVNYRARYLVCPMNKEDTIVIRCTKPDYGIRYFGYMVCDRVTTETEDCVNFDELEKEYVIFVSNSYFNAKNRGYDETNKCNKLLLFKNNQPVIVYREIRMDKEGLFSLKNDASQTDIRRVMGEYFPEITMHY